jgi:hypothetical protein
VEQGADSNGRDLTIQPGEALLPERLPRAHRALGRQLWVAAAHDDRLEQI